MKERENDIQLSLRYTVTSGSAHRQATGIDGERETRDERVREREEREERKVAGWGHDVGESEWYSSSYLLMRSLKWCWSGGGSGGCCRGQNLRLRIVAFFIGDFRHGLVRCDGVYLCDVKREGELCSQQEEEKRPQEYEKRRRATTAPESSYTAATILSSERASVTSCTEEEGTEVDVSLSLYKKSTQVEAQWKRPSCAMSNLFAFSLLSLSHQRHSLVSRLSYALSVYLECVACAQSARRFHTPGC